MAELYVGGLLCDGGGEIVDGQAVLVQDSKGAKVAPAGEVSGFEGETTGTSGGTLMPGLFDCHAHLCLGSEGDPGTAADKLLPEADHDEGVGAGPGRLGWRHQRPA